MYTMDTRGKVRKKPRWLTMILKRVQTTQIDMVKQQTNIWKNKGGGGLKNNVIIWFLFEILLPKKFSYSCFHGAPLLPAFIWRFLPEYTFNQQKIHFLARVSSARHIQWLDVDEELLLSVSFSFSKFILPRFLAAFSACLRAAFHILQSFC